MLENREGDRFTLGLQKCLDGSAQCSLKVNHLWKTKNSTTNLAKSSVGGVRKSPDHKKHQKSIHFEQGVETKS